METVTAGSKGTITDITTAVTNTLILCLWSPVKFSRPTRL